MLKKIIVLIIMLFPSIVLADELTLGDLRISYENILNEKKKYDSLTNNALKEIEQREELVGDYLLNITSIDEKILELEESIKLSDEKINSLKDEANQVLKYMQVLENKNAYLEYVSSSNGVSDLLRRIEALREVMEYINGSIKELENEINNNNNLIEELLKNQTKMEEDIEKFKVIIANNYGSLEEYDKYSLDINEEYEAAKRQYEKYKELCLMNTGRVDDAVLIEDCNKVPLNGGWLKPLSSGHVTSIVGYRYETYHNGIDIGGNLEGTPIYAAATGVVKAIIPKTTCGGNRVYINVYVGGVKYTTYYYHLLEFGDIEVGDIVTQDTIIGYVGGGRSTSALYGGYDECTTGSHLHFGVQLGWSSNINIDINKVIVPPGFLNSTSYYFEKRSDFYTG